MTVKDILALIGIKLPDNNQKKIKAKDVRDSFQLMGEKIETIASGYKDYLKIDDITPVVKGLYKLLEVGDYLNLSPAVDSNGNSTIITAEEGKINEAYFNGQNWLKSDIEIPQATQYIPSFEGSVFPIIGATQRNYNNTIWELPIGETSTNLEIPGNSDKWLKKTLTVDDVLNIATTKTSVVLGGNFEKNLDEINFTNSTWVTEVDNPYLNNLGLNKINYEYKGSTNVESYWWAFRTASGEPNGLAELFQTNKGKYARISWYIYSKNGLIPANLEAGRIGVILNNGSGNILLIGNNSPNGAFILEQVDPEVFKVDKTVLIDFSGTVNYILFTNVLEQAQIPSDYEEGDFSFTGLKVAFADTSEELNYRDIVGDWQTTEDVELLIDEKISDAEIVFEQIAENKINEKIKLNSSIKGGNFNPIGQIFSVGATYAVKDNLYLQALNSTKIVTTGQGGNGNVECYAEFDAEKRAEYFANSGKYIKIKWKVFSKNGVMCTPTSSGRLGVIGIQNSVSYDTGNVTYTQINANIFECTAVWKITQTSLPGIIYLCSVWESDRVANNYVIGDLGITAFGVWYADSLLGLADLGLKYDWIINPDDILTIKSGDERFAKISDIPDPEKTNYNNVGFNQTALSTFLKKYISKETDDFNQITIGMTGDSILGRQDNPAFNPANPEMSLTPDCNNPNESQYGYVTGHFPPNMWAQVVGFEVLKMMQYRDADVKYFNHVAPEVTKIGSWTNVYPVGNDCLRLLRTSTINSKIRLRFSGASFVKWLYSCYGVNSATRKIKVLISDDNSVTWKTPAQLGLIESLESAVDGSGIYYLPVKPHKWGNIIWKGFDVTKTYDIDVEKIDAIGTLDIWGFETWSKPRINVVIAAEGGNVAASQNSAWDRFYSSMYNQDLVIYNVPYLNDLGVGGIQQFGGSISLSTVISNPTQNDFYFVTETNTYPNFGNLKLFAGDYVEWSGLAWRKGSTIIKNAFSEFLTQNKAVYQRATKIGIPVLCLVTHESTSFNNKPYTWGYGLLLQRLMLKEAGLPYIDINRYQEINNLQDVWSDGTHLNDHGVLMYIEPISEVLSPENKFVGISSGKPTYMPLQGNAQPVFDVNNNIIGYNDNVSFGFEFKKIPKVRLYNTTRTIQTITKSGFTTVGSGNFDFEAFVN